MSEALLDLLRILRGDRVEPYPLLDSQERNFGVTGPAEVQVPAPAGPPLIIAAEQNRPPHVSSRRLDQQLTSRVVAAARRQSTTVNGVIGAAVVSAGRAAKSSWREAPLRVFANIDTRKTTGVGKSSSLQILGGTVVVDTGAESGFWDVARTLNTSLVPFRSRAAMEVTSQILTNAASIITDSAGTLDFLTKAFQIDVDISNVGVLDAPPPSGDINLVGLWGSSFLIGVEDEQNLGVLTVNGEMHLLYTSYTPIPNFLKSLEETFRTHCDCE